MGKINKVSSETAEKIRRKSAAILPDNPTACGWKPKDIRDTLFRAITDTANSALAEINRVVDEANAFLPDAIHVSYDGDTGKLTVTIKNEDGTVLATKSTQVNVDTAGLADCAVTEDKLSDALQEFVATSKSGLSGLLERESDKQDKTDDSLTTASNTVVGAINELDASGKAMDARVTTAETELSELKQTVSKGITYIGTMEYDAENEKDIPDGERLEAFVKKTLTGGELVLAVQKLSDATDLIYSCLFNKDKNAWDVIPMPGMERASGNNAGLLQGGYSDDDTLYVDIHDGRIVDIKAGSKGDDGTFTAVSIKGLRKLYSDVESILSGSVAVKKAEKAENDSEGNKITDTYMTKSAGASKAYVRKYALPVEFNDALYITSDGLVKTVPTGSGAQYEVSSSQIGYVDLFTAAYDLHDDEGGTRFELSAKNSFNSTVFVQSEVTENVQFRVVISAGDDSTGANNRNLAIVVTLDTPLVANTLTAVSVTGLFDLLGDDILKLDGADESTYIVMKMQAIRGSSKAQKFSVFSNGTYRSVMHLSTAFQTVAVRSGKVGEILQMDFTEYEEQGDSIVFSPPQQVPPNSSLIHVTFPYVGNGVFDEYTVGLNIGGVTYHVSVPMGSVASLKDFRQTANASGKCSFLVVAAETNAGLTLSAVMDDLSDKLDKQTTSGDLELYAVKGTSQKTVIPARGATPNSIPLRGADGLLQAGTPTESEANKSFCATIENTLNKLPKVTTAGNKRAYTIEKDGSQSTLDIILEAIAGSIPQRSEDGSLLAKQSTEKDKTKSGYKDACVNNEQLDAAVATIVAALEEKVSSGQLTELLATKVSKRTMATDTKLYLYGAQKDANGKINEQWTETDAGTPSAGSIVRRSRVKGLEGSVVFLMPGETDIKNKDNAGANCWWVTEQLKNYVKKSATASVLYGTKEADGVVTETDYSVSGTATANSVPLRDANGRMKAALPAADDDVATQGFVNSSITNNAADYISDNEEPFGSLEALKTYTTANPGKVGPNDYAIVKSTDSNGNTVYTRYKYSRSTKKWGKEYDLNNSTFTAAQWAAINSGISKTSWDSALADITSLKGKTTVAGDGLSITENGSTVTIALDLDTYDGGTY